MSDRRKAARRVGVPERRSGIERRKTALGPLTLDGLPTERTRTVGRRAEDRVKLQIAGKRGGGSGGVIPPVVQPPPTPTGTYLGATLPLTRYEPAFSLPSGTVRTVTGSGGSSNFQTLLNTSARGDVILIPAGTILTGQFTLPAKTGAGWIYVMSDAVYNGTFTVPAGQRATSSHTSQMPTLRTTGAGAQPVLRCAVSGPTVSHWRFVGLQFDLAPGLASTSRMIELGWLTPSSLSDCSNNMVLDRCVFTGHRDTDLIRAVRADVYHLYVTGCSFYSINHTGSDSQAIQGNRALGDWHIENCYFEGATENVMPGGSGIINWATDEYADITIRRNHFYTELWRRSTDPSYYGRNYVLKNLMELKGGTRCLIEDNVFENFWSEDQDATLNIKTVDSTGGSQFLRDVVIRYNHFKNTTAIGVIVDQGGATPERIVFAHNYAPSMIAAGSVPAGIKPQTGTDVVIQHNSLIQPSASATAVSLNLTLANLVVRDNIQYKGLYGWKASGQTEGTNSINSISGSTATFEKNVIVGATAGNYPTSNAITPQPANTAAVGFTDSANGDFSLAASSAYKGAATDGTDIGADVTAVLSRTSGCETGVWS